MKYFKKTEDTVNAMYRREDLNHAKTLMLSNCGAGEDPEGPWTVRRSNRSILKEVNPAYSLEGLMLAEAEVPILWPPDVKG